MVFKPYLDLGTETRVYTYLHFEFTSESIWRQNSINALTTYQTPFFWKRITSSHRSSLCPLLKILFKHQFWIKLYKYRSYKVL